MLYNVYCITFRVNAALPRHNALLSTDADALPSAARCSAAQRLAAPLQRWNAAADSVAAFELQKCVADPRAALYADSNVRP
jgi:hypothetical protein